MNQKHQPLPFHIFFKHFTRNVILGISVTLLILFLGMMGFRFIEKISWLDAYANCALIISGVGTLINPVTDDGKFFMATYSLIGGGCYLLVIGVIFSPIFHWMGRKMKVEDREHFK